MRRRWCDVLHRATPERLSAFSDGVFAVLITVLVLDLRPPEQPTFTALMSAQVSAVASSLLLTLILLASSRPRS
jgi:uncharacterized membrane protein